MPQHHPEAKSTEAVHLSKGYMGSKGTLNSQHPRERLWESRSLSSQTGGLLLHLVLLLARESMFPKRA